MLRLILFAHQFVSSCAIVLARDEVCQLPSEPVRRVPRMGVYELPYQHLSNAD